MAHIFFTKMAKLIIAFSFFIPLTILSQGTSAKLFKHLVLHSIISKPVKDVEGKWFKIKMASDSTKKALFPFYVDYEIVPFASPTSLLRI